VRLGFDPSRERTDEDGATRLTLRSCPFSEMVTASAAGGRVCALHHGLLAGVAAAHAGTVESFTVNDPRKLPCELSVR
jgi:predicted ArsR family transcriptional regulator